MVEKQGYIDLKIFYAGFCTHPISLSASYAPFVRGWDLCEDQSVIAVELPGHAVGQIGLFLNINNKKRYFLVADACWLSASYQNFIMPHPITRLLFVSYKEYRETLQKIHNIHKEQPQLHIVPSHCQATLEKHKHEKETDAS